MKKAILTLLLAALALPVAAAAEEEPSEGARPAREARTLEVEGPLLIKGRGRLTGELTMANPAGTRAVVLGGRVGAVKLVDLAGDLRVRCNGRGTAVVREDDEGHKVVICRGRGGRVAVHGSHFELQLVARSYGALLPAGVTGTLTGHFRSCVPGETCPAAGEGAAGHGGKPSPKPPKGDPPSDDEIEQAIDEALGGNG